MLSLLPVLLLAAAPVSPSRVIELKDAVRDVALSPDGKRLAVSAGQTVFLVDLASGEREGALRGHAHDVYGLSFSPDGTLLASAGSDDGTVRVWDLASGETKVILSGHEGLVYRGAFSPDGTTIASCSADDTIRLWNAATGAQLRVLQTGESIVWDLAFSPDGASLASVEGELTVRDVRTGRELRTMPAGGIASVVAYSPDGRLLVSAGDGNAVALWEASTGKLARTLAGHTESLRAAAFTADGRLLATGDYEGTVILWDVGGGQKLAALKAHEGTVGALVFTKDGRSLVSGSWDETVKLWDVSGLAPGPRPAAKPSPRTRKGLPRKPR